MDPEVAANTIARLADLLEEQARASAKREERLEEQARASAKREERLEQRMLAIAESASQASQTLTQAGHDGAPTVGGDSGANPEATPRPPSRPVSNAAPRRFGTTATPAPRLVEGASLREFSSWRDKFKGYALLTGLNDLPQDSQTAALMSLLDDQWTRVLRHGLDVDISTSDTTAIIDSMERHLREQRNIILDRRDFFNRQQEDGEPFDDFLVALREIAQFCDFCGHCADSQLRDKIVMGVRSEDTLRALLSEKDLTLHSAINICRARENAQQNSAGPRLTC